MLLTDPFAVIATYKKADSEDFTRVHYAYEENNNTDGYIVDLNSFDMTVAGSYNVKISYTYSGTIYETTFPINVWGKEFTVSDVTVLLDADAEGKEYGVTGANVVPSTNENVATAIANVIEGDNYVAYDITLAYAEGYAAKEANKTVTLPIPEGVTNPGVYYVSDDGSEVVNMHATKNEDGTAVTFTTTHFSTYAIGESTEITVPENSTATGSGTTTTTEKKEVYVLVSAPTAGKQYIIVNRNTAGSGYALKENTTTGSSITVNAAGNGVSAPYIESTDETIMWNTASGMTFQSENGSYYLRYNDGLTFSTRSSTNWTVDENQLYREGMRNDYWLRYNNGWTMGSSGTIYNVYFYEKQTVEVETTTTVTGTSCSPARRAARHRRSPAMIW